MQMTVERKSYYRDQIKFYLIKLWSPISNDKKKNNESVVENKIIQRNAEPVFLDDICSVGSVAGSIIPNNQVINDNQNYTKTVNDEKSSFMQSESISDETITSFERIIYFLLIPFFGLVITDYILFSIEVNLYI